MSWRAAILMSFYTGPPLRAWQLEAIAAWEKHNSGIVQAVPGAGKTLLAIRLLASKLEAEPGLKVLIVCPRLTLIQQWADAIASFSGIKRKEIYEISSNNEIQAYSSVQKKLPDHRIFISTFHQIRQFFGEFEWKKHEWFLIVDEMHNTRENFAFPGHPVKYKLGLSATPKKRKKGADFNLGGIIYTYPFSRALQDKIILDPVIKIVFYSVSGALFRKIENKGGSTLDLAESAFDELLEDKPAQERAKEAFTPKHTDLVGIRRILEEKFNIGKPNSVQTLVFVNRIKKADLLNSVLSESFSDKVSHSYHSKSENYHQKSNFAEIKKQFAEGKFNVLISVGTLGEGIDFPYASHGIIASPVYNSRSFVQKVGRLLRAYEGHKKAVIYYYVPSELVTRLLMDEKIEPNYFKSVVKIADENKDLYFVDRESLEEEKGSMEDLLLMGAAYERNDYVGRIKVPHDLDQIMRFFKRAQPGRLSGFRHLYGAESEGFGENIDFLPLRLELSKSFRQAQFLSRNLANNLKNIEKLQKKFAGKKFGDLSEIRRFVRAALDCQVVAKIKYGTLLADADKGKKHAHSSEQEMLFRMVAAELTDFCSRAKETRGAVSSLSSAIRALAKHAEGKPASAPTINARIKAMASIAKSFFSLQSAFLDELDMADLAKSPPSGGNSIFLAIGKDIFLGVRPAQLFAYPRDFGIMQGEEEKELAKKEIALTPAEKFAKRLLHSAEKETDFEGIASSWQKTRRDICAELKIPLLSDQEITRELERQKFLHEFPLVNLLLALEAIKKAAKEPF